MFIADKKAREAVAWFREHARPRFPGKSKMIKAIRDSKQPMTTAKAMVAKFEKGGDKASAYIVVDAYMRIRERVGGIPSLEGRLLAKLTQLIRKGKYKTAGAQLRADAIVEGREVSWGTS